MIKQLLRSFHPLEQLERKRVNEIKKGVLPKSCSILFDYPIPSPDTLIEDIEFVVLDFETTGLDSNNDEILSVGSVTIKEQILSLSSAQHFYMLAANAIKPETAIINHILPEVLIGGCTEKECMEKLLVSLAGKVVIAHCAEIEQRFLRRALELSQDTPLPIVFIDTLKLAKSLSDYWGQAKPDLRLSEIRQKKGLPPYLAHNAFADAVATGELFLVLVKEIFSGKPVTIGALFSRSQSH
ncbi:exonuclease domain-containing protein [Vibrio hibernica]|uniref:exonuclease domain-containing protein n=1 Tax=Vibrio hibernica TaxID=2587465 RepID=UPI0039B0E6AC